MTPNEYINHEVRIQLLEKLVLSIDAKFTHLEAKIDTNFHWTIGTLVTLFVTIITLFGAIILTKII